MDRMNLLIMSPSPPRELLKSPRSARRYKGKVRSLQLERQFSMKNVTPIFGVSKRKLELRYQILPRELGRGGFSVVVAARKRGDENRTLVAVKRVQRDSLEEDDVEALKREVQVMKMLRHPNVVRILDVFESAAEIFVVQKLIEGKELFDVIVERGHFAEDDARTAFRTILNAVSYLHGQGVVHRDLKPQNMMCNDRSEVTIIDFGFATLKGGPVPELRGSAGYLAPELVRGEQGTQSVDMWAIGVVLYILLCGFPPFHAASQAELFRQICDADIDFSDEDAWGNVSDGAKELVCGLLEQNATLRMTAAECLRHPWVTLTDIYDYL